MENVSINTESIAQPLRYERDSAVVKLSQVIGEIASAKQNHCINIQHLEQFKESFIRLSNLTISDSKLRDIKYMNTDKSLITVVEKIRNEDTTLKNIDHHCKVACIYFNALFSTGILSI